MSFRKFSLLFFMLLGAFACNRLQTDAETMQILEAAASGCQIDQRSVYLKGCKRGESDNIKMIIKRKGVFKTLGTVSVALKSKNENLRLTAAYTLYNHFRFQMLKFASNPAGLERGAVNNLLEGLKAMQGRSAFYITAVTTHAATISGRQKVLYQILEQHPLELVKQEGYRNIMTYGRLNTFPRIKQLSLGREEWQINAALEAPSNMYRMTAEEKLQICEWIKPWLNNPDEHIALKAANVLASNCGGDYINLVLDAAATRAKKGNLKPPFSYALEKFSCRSAFGNPEGTPEQCRRKQKLERQVRK